MTQSEMIINFIKTNCQTEIFINGLLKSQNLGITTTNISNEFGILRNNASSILNGLYKKNILVKINSRPVTFITKEIIEDMHKNYNLTIKNTYSLKELIDIIKDKTTSNSFEKLLGYNSSLLSQIGQAKAAIVYPPRGLHTLLLGESGVGKTTFARAMHEYGLYIKGKTIDKYPFITFNCSDYFNNPQLLISQLFGHAKGAFTGADIDKTGLVEEANGGILFLDEIHRLPPDGQEMLFYLMDKGEYNRLGENIKRKSNVLIIAATTEDPNATLLNTFMRRIPVNIILPKYKDKPVEERVELIQHFFYTESLNLNKKISIAPEVLKALALYDFKNGNIGNLRSEIKLLCANAFLQHIQNKQDIYIGYQILNKNIRDILLNYLQTDKNTTNYLDMFSEDIIITPNKNDFLNYETEDNIYCIISNKLDNLRRQGIAINNITEILKNDIEHYLSTVSKHFNNTNCNISNLYKLVPKDIINSTMQFIEIARNKLHVSFNNHFLFSLSLHIQELLKRIEDNSISPNQHLFKIKKEHPDEFYVANIIVKKISDKFGVVIPESEKGFLALLLFHSKIELSNKNKIGIIIICHGESTASSIANTCNSLLNTTIMKSIDMPLVQSIDETYNKFKSMAITINKGKGIIILSDMGSLLNFDKKLMEDTGIKAKTIGNVSTPLALEVLRHVLYDIEDIDNLYENNKTIDINNKLSHTKKKLPVILSVCSTGKGSSVIIRDILKDLIDTYYLDNIQIMTVDIDNAKNEFRKLKEKYFIIAIVGTIDPLLPVPFFPINKLMDPEVKQILLHLLDGNIKGNVVFPDNKFSYTIFETAKDLLEKYVKFINPRYAINKIRKFIDKIEYYPKNDGYMLDLIIHMGCMLDRCIGNINIEYSALEQHMEKEPSLFKKIKLALSDIEESFNISISYDEIAYIIKIIKR